MWVGARTVQSFHIKSVSGAGSIEFFDRLPDDREIPIEEYWVRITDANLSAAGRVCASCYIQVHPAPLFAEMAEKWAGWPGELVWESVEGELLLRCTQDRAGHVSVRITLQSGWTNRDWKLDLQIWTEAGQLEGLARRAESFFGRLSFI